MQLYLVSVSGVNLTFLSFFYEEDFKLCAVVREKNVY